MNISSIVKAFILIQIFSTCLCLLLWQPVDTKMMGKVTYTKEIQNID